MSQTAARLIFSTVAFVTLWPLSAQAVLIDWVTVGNPGNAADQLYTSNNPGSLLFGSVSYTYRIGRYEVTNNQYIEFLNAVAATDTNALYSANMGSSDRGGITQSGTIGSFTYAVKTNMGNKPVNYVSFFDAMRFVNWLENGQPTGAQGSGTTEDGVYTIGTGLSETRASGASFFLPSEDEWYKAAYHQPSAEGGDTDDYWLYPTASNTAPTMATATAMGDIANPGTKVANYNFGADWNSENGNVTTVGSAGAGSANFYETFDQGGNVWEWNEAIVSSSRSLRGGSAGSFTPRLAASDRSSDNPVLGTAFVGFRVASPFPQTAVIPEPGTLALGSIGAVVLLILGWRRSWKSTA